MSEQKCQGRCTQFFGVCERKPTVERGGKHYCWQHDPDRLRAVAAAKWELRKAEMRAEEEAMDRRIERRRLEEAAGLRELSDDDLRLIIKLGGVRIVIDSARRSNNN